MKRGKATEQNIDSLFGGGRTPWLSNRPPAGSKLRHPRVEVAAPDMPLEMNPIVLRPYQIKWANDPSRFAIAVKSAQIGYSTATAAWAVKQCVMIPGRTVIFLSRSERQSLELAQRSKAWIDGLRGAAAHFVPGRALGGTSTLQHEIRFPNGSRIIALAANPDTARGYTGDVVLDEFAFHQDSQAIFTAVYRQVSLGYFMRVLSTPNGQRGKFYELAKQLGLADGIEPVPRPVRLAAPSYTAAPSPTPLRGFPPLPKGEGLGVRAREGAENEGGQEGVGDSSLIARHSSPNPWSGHWCDIFKAVREGLKLNPAEIQAGCDEDTWRQEYCCQFISQASEWISPELFQQCVSSEATTDVAAVYDRRVVPETAGAHRAPLQNLYAGWDIARNRDLSVIWISELVGDVTWTRGIIEMRDTPTPEQVRQARALLSGETLTPLPSPNGRGGTAEPWVRDSPLRGGEGGTIRRLNIDKSGMGLVIYEQLAREFPGQVEGVQFTQQTKEQMAVLAKRRLEEAKVRLPDSDAVRQAFRAVKKTVNAVGQVRFDAEHDARTGHADHWWAFCLAEAAAQQPAYHFAGVGALVGRPVAAGLRHAVL